MTIDDFVKRIDEAQKEYPFESEIVLQAGAKKMVKALKNASPQSMRDHKRKLNKSWKLTMEGMNSRDIKANIRSTAPHFHLVERGHVMKNPHGKVIGYKQGTFFKEKTVKSEGTGISEEMGKKLYKKLGDKLG